MKDKVMEILGELHPEFEFTEGVDFFEKGMLDSFDMVTLVMDLENAFGIRIDGVEVIPENFSTVENIVALLKSKGVN